MGGDLATLLWQTYGFGNIIKSNDVTELTPPWGTEDDNAVRVGKNNVPIKYIRSKKNPLFVEKLEFTYKNHGKKEEGNTGSEQKNDPFRTGYSPWVYQITEYLNVSNIYYPKEFKFEIFYPKKNADGSYGLETMKSISATVLSFKTGVKKSDWLPNLTGKTIVSDKRFTTLVTNWSSVNYFVTNQWYDRSHPIVQKAVRTHINAVPDKVGKTSN